MKKKVTKDDVKKWASVQRREYNRLRKGLCSTITAGQIAKLNGIGFEWASPKRKKSTAHDEGGENLKNLDQCCFENQECDESWEFMFERYKKCNPNPRPRNEARREAHKSLSPEVKAAQNQKKNEAQKQARMSLSPEVKAAQNRKKSEAEKQARKFLSPEVKAAQNWKKNETRKEACKLQKEQFKTNEKSPADAYLENLASRILDMVDISKVDIDFMADEQRFARHPNLALAY